MVLSKNTAVQLLEMLRQGASNSREVTAAFVDAIEVNDPKIRSFVRWDKK